MREIKHLLTKAGESFSGCEHNKYPRPQLVRESYFSLNGAWDFSVSGLFSGEIIVPFSPESLLSRVHKVFPDATPLTYKKQFTLHQGFIKDKVILHFGAVDGICSVYLNDHLLGVHMGGYDSFSFDVTDYINRENTIAVEVIDALKDHTYPYGKQSYKRGGMWYTPISGIWQSVWLESVPRDYIKSLKIDTGLDFCKIYLEGATNGEVTLHLPEGDKRYPIINEYCKIKFDSPILWSPESPHLYHFTAKYGRDEIKSYFALRKIEVDKVGGIARILLNGKPYFFNGVLDQGYFSDGIYTPADPSEYENDILKMKSLGFNTIRKHIKVEPEEFYYQCDRLGMVVFQDMVNNGKYSFLRDTALPTIGIKRLSEKLLKRTDKQKNAFVDSLKKTVSQLYNHPSVCYYTIFNEGWGQFDSDKMYFTLKELDQSRIVDTNSGWFGGHTSDVESLHVYFKRVKIKESKKPIILSEFGGYSYKVSDHCANDKKTYGYKLFKEQGAFEDALISLYENEIIPSIKNGLCGAIYTQLSDVEDETNGFLTYDRRVCKVNEQRIREVMEKAKI